MERDFGLYVFTILYRAMRPDFCPHSTRQSGAYFPTEPPLIPLTTDRCLALLAGIKGRSGRSGHVQTQCPTPRHFHWVFLKHMVIATLPQNASLYCFHRSFITHLASLGAKRLVTEKEQDYMHRQSLLRQSGHSGAETSRKLPLTTNREV